MRVVADDRSNSILLAGDRNQRLKARISQYFAEDAPGISFKTFDTLSPIVSVRQNFDDLLIPADHVSRRATENSRCRPS